MQVYEPSLQAFTNTETGIVLYNHFGATAFQDTKRDAQHLADTFEMPVIAVNRPGTEGWLPSSALANKLSTPEGYVDEISRTGRQIDRQIDALGLSKVAVVGRSAGGLGALALARSETISSLKTVFAAEPVGCEKLPLNEGRAKYAAALKQQADLLKNSSPAELIKPAAPGLPFWTSLRRLASIPPAMLRDKYYNQHIFASNAAVQYAAYIASHLPEVDTTVMFAEYSMVAGAALYRKDLAPLNGLRLGGAPFEVTKANSTVHASFDNRAYMNHVLRPVISRLLVRSSETH